MTDIDPTPSTPVTIGDRLAWWRTELRQALADLRTAPQDSLREIRDEVNLAYMNTMGGQAKSLTDLDARLENLRDMVYDGLYHDGGVTKYPAHIRLNAELVSISERLDYIQAALGAQPYESLELASVRGLLQALVRANSDSTYGLTPITGQNDIADDGFTFLNGRKYALFNPPIANITISNDGKDLTPSPNWSGWSVYIQTNAPSAYLNDASDFVNAWLPMVGTGSCNFSVDAQYNIRVFLRRPLASYSCITINSTSINYGSLTRNGIDWVGTIFEPFAQSADPRQLYNARHGAKPYLIGNFNGNVRMLSGTAVLILNGVNNTLNTNWLGVNGSTDIRISNVSGVGVPVQICLSPYGQPVPQP